MHGTRQSFGPPRCIILQTHFRYPRLTGPSLIGMATVDFRAEVRRVLPSVRADLEALVRIESVSADPSRAAEVRRSAQATAKLFEQSGCPDVRVLSVPSGFPAVVARYPAPSGAPTVLLYAHHDVQPEGPPEDWDTEPFIATEHGGRLYGRGAADDKAGIAAHLAAIRAHGNAPPVGVTVFVEGEEEIGSPTLAAFLTEYADLLAADVIVLADSTNWDIGVPALTTSLRGLVDCIVEVRTLDHAVHSGMWGGVVPDAPTVLSRLLATLHDAAGNVAVKGLGAGLASDLDYPEDRVRSDAGIAAGVQLLGTGSAVERLWAKPSVSVLAIDAPRVADASNTLVPWARAKVSLRIAPGDDAQTATDALVEHLRTHADWGAQVTVTPGEIAEPYAIDATGATYDLARQVFAAAWDGVPPVDIGVGGSIPFIAAFADAFPAASIIVSGVEDPDTRSHGANEGLHLAEFERVCLAETLLLARVLELGARSVP
jgi:acetylornithine deacetylase/succinyl-diaminopimelate desuccinylase-like protein